jgi:hypothetical protein
MTPDDFIAVPAAWIAEVESDRIVLRDQGRGHHLVRSDLEKLIVGLAREDLEARER